MAEEWGPWVDHDGKGCPAQCIGAFVLLELRLSAHDEDGGKPDNIHYNEFFVCKKAAHLPEWWTENFGKIVTCMFRGIPYACCEILRYRIRKPRGLTILQDLMADLPAPTPERVE